MTTYAPLAGLPYFGGAVGVIHTDPLGPFAALAGLANSAVVFTPAGAGYTLTVH